MKKADLKSLLLFFIFFTIISNIFVGCGSCGSSDEEGPTVSGQGDQDDVAYVAGRDEDIQRYNIEQARKLSPYRFPCDTNALRLYVFDNYKPGTYLVLIDKALTFGTPVPAVIYEGDSVKGFDIYALIAESWDQDHRFIEVKNIVGYDQSYIDLDSTELGTAFFYLTYFKCTNDDFAKVWEAKIPSHGGFNRIYKEVWKKKIPYIRSNFHYAQGVGHIDYNYFFINGKENPPHLLMTYEGINFKREMIDADGNDYPDYREYKFLDTGDMVTVIDTVTFIWKDSLYVNTRNPKQTRPY